MIDRTPSVTVIVMIVIDKRLSWWMWWQLWLTGHRVSWSEAAYQVSWQSNSSSHWHWHWLTIQKVGSLICFVYQLYTSVATFNRVSVRQALNYRWPFTSHRGQLSLLPSARCEM